MAARFLEIKVPVIIRQSIDRRRKPVWTVYGVTPEMTEPGERETTEACLLDDERSCDHVDDADRLYMTWVDLHLDVDVDKGTATAVMVEAGKLIAEERAGVCRKCGCTDDDCTQCVEKTGEPCSWVEPDLCSACA